MSAEHGSRRGTIGRANHVADSTPDFNFLHGHLPRNITPSDLDGLVEIDGKFWAIEFKGTGKNIPKGQMLMLERLVKAGWCVSVIWHDGLTRENKFTAVWYMIPGRRRIERTFWTEDGADYEAAMENVIEFSKWFSKWACANKAEGVG